MSQIKENLGDLWHYVFDPTAERLRNLKNLETQIIVTPEGKSRLDIVDENGRAISNVSIPDRLAKAGAPKLELTPALILAGVSVLLALAYLWGKKG